MRQPPAVSSPWRGKVLAPAALGGLLLGLWELYVRGFGLDPFLLPAPSQVAGFLMNHLPLFLRHGFFTASVIAAGFLAGTALGLLLGLALHASRLFREAAYPWMVASQMIPIPALAPILVLWFGFSFAPKMIVVALIAFFPVAVNTLDGLSSVNPEMVRLLRSFGAGPWRVLRLVSLPAALPRVFSGLRVSMALSVIGAIFGEWVGSSRGLGFLILQFNHRGQTDALFATVAVLSALGISLFFVVNRVERKCLPWVERSDRNPPEG